MRYVWAAIISRVEGVPANLLFLLAAFVVGLYLPWVWVMSFLLELAFVTGLSLSPRFRRAVDAERRVRDRQRPRNKDALVAQLQADDQLRLQAFEKQIREAAALASAQPGGLPERTQAGLDQLAFAYLKLLLARTHGAGNADAVKDAQTDLAALDAYVAEALVALARGLPVEVRADLPLHTPGLHDPLDAVLDPEAPPPRRTEDTPPATSAPPQAE